MIAEPPISDARAKAEARRAKILAREAARLTAAKGEKQEGNNETAVTAENEDASPKGKERPLAARRNLVKKASVEEEVDGNAAEIKVSAETVSVEDSKDSDGNKVEITTASEKTATIKITSQRTRDIEKEIVINNAVHDKAHEVTSEKKQAVVKKVAVRAVATPLQPFQVMRFLRMTAIIALAIITGYRSGVKNMDEITTFTEAQKGVQKAGTGNALDDFLGNVQNPAQFNIPSFYGNAKASSGSQQSRTWLQWLNDKVLTQTECTFSAVGVVWWASTVVSPFVSKSLPKNQKGMNIMNMVISFYNNGMEGVFDTVLSRIGELCLHFLVMVATPMMMTSLALNEQGFSLPGMGGQEL